jgi:hypothetical protein
MLNNFFNADNTLGETSRVRYFFKTIANFLGRAIIILVALNPLLFWLWALVFPHKMADLLSSAWFYRNDWRKALKRADIWEVVHLLPEKYIFTFMQAIPPKEFPDLYQRIHFSHYKKEDWQLSDYSPKNITNIWTMAYGNIENMNLFITKGLTLSDEELISLMEEPLWPCFRHYASMHTSSNKVMRELYAKGEKEAFFYLVSKNGADLEITRFVESFGHPEDIASLRAALKKYSQKQIIRSTKRSGDEALFKKLVATEKIDPKLLHEICLWQYKSLLKAGKHLPKEVILAKATLFTPTEWEEWVTLFLENEDLDFPEWEYIVLNNFKLRKFIMEHKKVSSTTSKIGSL